MITIISMPWISARMPSIQLGTVHAYLRDQGIDVYSRSVNYEFAEVIGFDLYDFLSSRPGPAEEWAFSSIYFGNTSEGEYPTNESWAAAGDPQDIAKNLRVVADGLLTSVAQDAALQKSHVIGFTLTIAQLGSSIALAKKLRTEGYKGFIIFGGSACDGTAAGTMLDCFPEVDAIYQGRVDKELLTLIHSLYEGVIPPTRGNVVTRCCNSTQTPERSAPGTPTALDQLSDPISSVVSRSHNGPKAQFILPDYDEYFRRLVLTASANIDDIWLPLESSVGCWWGEKVQCTFCGLAPDMTYRRMASSLVADAVVRLHERYGAHRFFMVDLIIPPEFRTEVTPALRENAPFDVQFFFEMKPTLSRAEFAELVNAGVVWMQPGIETLADGPLKRMRKGATVGHNLQVLRWAEEFGVRLSWNLLFAHPGDSAADYRQMLVLMPKLHHLPPPSGLGRIQIHRFSPLFDEMGGAHSSTLRASVDIARAFPVGDRHLRDLIYEFEYCGDEHWTGAEEVRELRSALDAWKIAYLGGASLVMHGNEVFDSRLGLERRVTVEDVDAMILRGATSLIPLRLLQEELETSSATSFDKRIAALKDRGFLVEIKDSVMSLVLAETAFSRRDALSPHAYLDI